MFGWIAKQIRNFNRAGVKLVTNKDVSGRDTEEVFIELLIKNVQDLYSEAYHSAPKWTQNLHVHNMKAMVNMLANDIWGESNAFVLNRVCDELVSRGHYTSEQIQPIRRELYQMLCQ